jgi:hypothetical protein
VRQLVRPDEYAIFLGLGPRAYWPAERYPNWPLINSDVQATYYIERHATSLLSALDDERLKLVEFNPESPAADDRRLLESPSGREFIRRFSCRVKARFVRRDDLLPPLVLWTRREGPPGDSGSAACEAPDADRRMSASGALAGRANR